jgi:hypothetical protein
MRYRLWRALVVGIMLVSVLAACAKAPDEVAQDFYEAFERHEFSKAKDNACSDLHDELEIWIKAEGDRRIDVDLNVTYQQLEKTSDRIRMRVSGTKRVGDQVFPVDYQMRLDKKGGWKVCDLRPTPGS